MCAHKGQVTRFLYHTNDVIIELVEIKLNLLCSIVLLLEPNLKLEQVHADNIKVGAPISQQIIVPCIEL